MNLSGLKPEDTAIIDKINIKGELGRRLLDMGLVPSTKIVFRRSAPFSGPVQISVLGYELCIRKSDAEKITVSRVNAR